jgi:hypothetical protein
MEAAAQILGSPALNSVADSVLDESGYQPGPAGQGQGAPMSQPPQPAPQPAPQQMQPPAPQPADPMGTY